MKFKKCAFILAVVCLLLSLTACSGKPKSEQEICAEIRNQFMSEYAYFASNDITITVDRRQTNKNEKTDYVWGTITANNGIVSIKEDYSAYYILYNDGWEMVDFECLNSDYQRIKSTISESDAEECFRNKYSGIYEELEYGYRDTDLFGGTDTFVYYAKDRKGYLTTTKEIKISYTHSYRTGEWVFDEVAEEDISLEWDILGEWICNDDEGTLSLYIHSVDLVNEKISVEYKFDYHIYNERVWPESERYQHFILESDGIYTTWIGESEDGYYFEISVDDSGFDARAYFTVSGVTFSGEWGFPSNQFTFQYVGQ